MGAPPTLEVKRREPHVWIGAAHRILPEYELAAISQTEIACSTETFTKVSTFAQFPACFVFQLRCSLDLIEFNLLIDGKLQGKTVEGPALLLGEAYLVLQGT